MTNLLPPTTSTVTHLIMSRSSFPRSLREWNNWQKKKVHQHQRFIESRRNSGQNRSRPNGSKQNRSGWNTIFLLWYTTEVLYHVKMSVYNNCILKHFKCSLELNQLTLPIWKQSTCTCRVQKVTVNWAMYSVVMETPISTDHPKLIHAWSTLPCGVILSKCFNLAFWAATSSHLDSLGYQYGYKILASP